MHYKKHALKNGLRIILAPMEENETVTVLVMTGVGSRFETRSENGLAHFLEHMFFKGTEKRPTALDISKELDGMGASYNAFTGKEYTGYYAKVEAHHWEKALDVVSDLFLNAKLEQEEINRERGTIIQEINMYEDTPMRHVGDLFERCLYGDQPLGWDIAGPKENIQKFKRQDFLKYLNRGYVSGNIVVGIAGNIDPKRIKKEVEKHFAHVRVGQKPRFKKVIESQKAPQILLQKKNTDQTHAILGVRAYDMYHPDRYVLAVMATILGGGMSSRMFVEVRERRGLAYDVRTAADSYYDSGYLATQANLDSEKFDVALQVMLDEYKKIATEKVSDEELLRAKDQIKGRMALGLEGSDDIIEYLVTQETIRGEIVLPKEKAKLIDKVTADDVLRVAKDIFQNKKLNLAVIGPHPDRSKLEKMVKF